MNEEMKLNKYRDFGAVFSDTYGFVFKNFKYIFRYLLLIPFPIYALAQFIVQKGGLFLLQLDRGGAESFVIGFIYLLSFIIFFVAMTLQLSVFFAIVKAYMNKEKELDFQTIWIKSIEKFWGTFVLVFLYVFTIVLVIAIIAMLIYLFGTVLPFLAVLIGIASLFVILILITKFFLVFPVYFFEDIPLVRAISRGMQVVNYNFWGTMGLIIVIGVINLIASFIFRIVMTIPVGAMSFGGSDPLFINNVLLVPKVLFSSLTYVIVYTASSLQYYSIVEKNEAPSIISKIDEINDDFEEKSL